MLTQVIGRASRLSRSKGGCTAGALPYRVIGPCGRRSVGRACRRGAFRGQYAVAQQELRPTVPCDRTSWSVIGRARLPTSRVSRSKGGGSAEASPYRVIRPWGRWSVGRVSRRARFRGQSGAAQRELRPTVWYDLGADDR